MLINLPVFHGLNDTNCYACLIKLGALGISYAISDWRFNSRSIANKYNIRFHITMDTEWTWKGSEEGEMKSWNLPTAFKSSRKQLNYRRETLKPF